MSKYAKVSLTLIVKESEAEDVLEALIQAEDIIKQDHWVYWDDAANLAMDDSELPEDAEMDIDDSDDSNYEETEPSSEGSSE